MLSVTTLGETGFACNGKPVAIPNRKAVALLAYLVLSGGSTVQRSHLSGLLWSESTPQRALTSLRRALLDLRTALTTAGCSVVDVSYAQVTIDRTRIRVDLSDILDAIASGGIPERLLSGPGLADTLLAGFDDLDPGFTEWVAAERRALEGRLIRTLMERIGGADLSRTQRKQFATAILLLDPSHEEACRIAMRSAAEAGETAEALRVYDRLYRVLDADHDMEPSIETRELLARIKLGEFEPPRVQAAPDTGEPPRLAVMPFRLLGPGTVPSYLAEGLVEDIVCMLAAMRDPVVISSNSTRALRDQEIDLANIGRLLDARYVVSGTIRAIRNNLRISVELAEAATGAVLWKHNHDTADDRFFDVHDLIVANVAHELTPQVHQAEMRRMRRLRPENLGAYYRRLEARELIFDLNQRNFTRAGDLLREAVAIDPTYAASYVTLSDWYSIRLGQGWSPDPARDARLLEDAARTALRHDPGNPHAMVMLGHNRTLLDLDYAEAIALFDRAESIAPNDAMVLTMSSPTFAFMGDPAEAVRRAERALRLSPHDPFAFRLYHFLSIAHYFCHAYAEAAHWGRESLRINPGYTSNLRMLACILVDQGMLDEARAMAARAMAIQPGFRVGPAVARYVSRDPERRRIYRQNLLAAGIPE